MKMTVITDKKGEVISTYAHSERSEKDDPILHIEPGRNQQVHEIDLPAELAKITSVDDLHHRVGEHLKVHKPKSR